MMCILIRDIVLRMYPLFVQFLYRYHCNSFFFYSAIKEFNALNLNPTASFNSIKATMINNTAPIYTVDNFKVKKLF